MAAYQVLTHPAKPDKPENESNLHRQAPHVLLSFPRRIVETGTGHLRPRRPGGGHSRRAAALAAVTLAAATACGIGGDDGSPGAACVSPGVTSDAIKAGLIYPNSGQMANVFSSFQSGVEARFASENAEGGVNGRSLTFVWQDDFGTDEGNQNAAEALVEREGVFSILELTTATRGSAEYLHDQGVPVFGPGLEPSWSTLENMFSWSRSVSPTSSTTTWGEFVRARGGTKAAVLGVFADPISQGGREAIANSMRTAGVEVVAEIDMNGNGLFSTQAIQQIKASGADTVAGMVLLPQAISLMEAVRTGGLSLKVVLTPGSLYDSDTLRRYGPLLDGVYVYLDILPFELNLPVHQEFRQAMARYAPESQPPERTIAVNGWIMADMFIEGVRRAGDCPTRSDLIRNLRQVRDYTAGGFLPGALDLTAYQDVSRCYSFVRFTSASFSVQDPPHICGKVMPLS